MTITNNQWIRAAAIRAIKTIAQTAVATIGTTTAMGQVDWRLVLSTSVLAGILSVLTSVAGIPEVWYFTTMKLRKPKQKPLQR